MKTFQFRNMLKSITVGFIIIWSSSLNAAEVVINAKIEIPRAKPFIYEMETPRPSEKDIIERCTKILNLTVFRSFSREMFKPVEDRLVMFCQEIEVSMNRKGTEFFYSNFPALKLTSKTGRLHLDDKAVKLALNYLKKTGLMPRNKKELKIDHVGGIMQMLSNAKEPEKKATVVYFYRELDGLKVCNFGSSITVTLAESEIPAGVQYHWREVASREKLRARNFLDADRIKSLIEKDVNSVFAKYAKVFIDKIELVLYDNGGNYIQPAYRYQGVCKTEIEGIDDMPVLGYVQAIDKVYEPISHPAFSTEMKAPTSHYEKHGHDIDE